MKSLNVFDEYRNNPSFNVVKYSLGYFFITTKYERFL